MKKVGLIIFYIITVFAGFTQILSWAKVDFEKINLSFLTNRIVNLSIIEIFILSIILISLTFYVYHKKYKYYSSEDLSNIIKDAKKKQNISVINNGVQYLGYCEKNGLSNLITDGTILGSFDENNRLLGLQIQLNNNLPLGMGVTYQVHVQDIGWLDWVKNSNKAGFIENKQIEAIKIKLTNHKDMYRIYYQSYVKSKEWTNWVSDGAEAGTTGKNLPILAFRAILLKIE